MSYYITFYSYKGGVGRTLSMVNVAASLTREGHDVILWEADLEAPGLLQMRRFHDLRTKCKGGLLDLLGEPDADAGPLVERYLLDVPVKQGRMRLLPAGRPDGNYSKRYHDALFGNNSTLGSVRFEEIRQAIEGLGADFVLIDSRTGITDVGGICTVQLPDAVVLVYRLDQQDACGMADIKRALRGDRVSKVRKNELRLVELATMVPGNWPELVRERLEALKTSGLEPEYQVPLVDKLLLEEAVWTEEFPEHELSKEYARLAAGLAEPVLLARTVETRAEERMAPDREEFRRERGSAFEQKVAKVLRLLGFEVQTNVMVEGREVDFIAVRKDPLQEVRFLGECKDHAKPVGVDVLDSLQGRLEVYQDKYKTAQGLLVARTGFTDRVKAQAKKLKISLKRYDELMDGLVDLGNYVAGLANDVKGMENYVEPDAFAEELGETVPLKNYVAQWLADPEALHLTLLGDYGTGKTWFTRRLAAQLARKYQEDPVKNRCPIRIDLRTAARALSLENVLYEHFQRQAGKLVNSEAVLHLLEEGRFVLIFDAFDEMATQGFWEVTVQNFRELARAAQGKAKVLLTCRTHFFRAADEVKALVEGRTTDLTADGKTLYQEVFGRKGFLVAYLRDFNEAQIAEYLDKAGAGGVKKMLETVGGLKEVAERPVLLDMIVRSAPRLRDMSEIRLATLYEAYTEEWLARVDWRQALDREGRRTLAQQLALRLWETDEARMHHRELRRAVAELLPERAKNMADVDVLDEDVRTASFFTRDAEGNYGFSHRSFLEFFVAQALARRMEQPGALELRRLSPEVVGFLVDLCERARLQRAVSDVLGTGYRPRASENALRIWHLTRLPEPPARELVFSDLAGLEPEAIAERFLESEGGQRSELQSAWLPRLTDVEREPRAEARAGIGRVLGRLGLDNRKGVGVKDGIPDIDWVKVGKFYMARYPVTNAQYEAFVHAEDGYKDDRWWQGLTKSDRKGRPPQWSEPNHPRETVNWYEAMAFCGWLSHRLGYEVRLPTDQEWERAAFGGRKQKYPWGNEYEPGYANINETRDKAGPHYLGRTSPVGMYPQGASPEGVLDLAGNVWEWCLNEHAKPERTQRSGTEPRVLRGGSWGFPHGLVAARRHYLPDFRYYFIGFRLVCSAPIPAGR